MWELQNRQFFEYPVNFKETAWGELVRRLCHYGRQLDSKEDLRE